MEWTNENAVAWALLLFGVVITYLSLGVGSVLHAKARELKAKADLIEAQRRNEVFRNDTLRR